MHIFFTKKILISISGCRNLEIFAMYENIFLTMFNTLFLPFVHMQYLMVETMVKFITYCARNFTQFTKSKMVNLDLKIFEK